MAMIDIQALTKCFGPKTAPKTAVDGFSLAVEPGEVFGLLGPNGAGKSTLIKMLTTLLPASGGRATIAGFDLGRQRVDVQRRIGYVPQALSVDGTLTGYENLLILAKLYGVPRRQRLERIQAALTYVGLDSVARKTMWELILQLRRDYGTTVFLTTHFMEEEADVLCDRIAML
ncbi:MAG: hypothetical protein DCF17_00060 [Shackletoniella antarctica]|jgi:ABC-2 type transport system ATP-binding protein|uniref:ABC transporter domain-containing protein n=1 Tax=Shackletoniella antarctica TaxID=268115 RepID=A0A2W4YEU3_9CYAN|nr:MAG: hypothetical protein DCF17_00060 [Shackletoniella antarctica]